MDTLVKYILLFFFYSAAGWCLETTYCSIGEKRFVNRGFLTGPMCPIYGTAALVLIIVIYNPFRDNPLAVFLLGIILCDIVEYATSFIMEKLFSARWWDYTYEFINIKGRICLKHTLYWGVISIVFVKTIHPAVENLYSKLEGSYLNIILVAVLSVFVLDLINAVRKAKYGNVYADTSGMASLKNMIIEYAVSQIGSERILFGTDTYSAASQRGRIEFSMISDRDKENILFYNAKELFGL